jgi:hypothetical protein
LGGGEQIDQWAVASDPLGLKFATNRGFPLRLKTAWISTEYRADEAPAGAAPPALSTTAVSNTTATRVELLI